MKLNSKLTIKQLAEQAREFTQSEEQMARFSTSEKLALKTISGTLNFIEKLGKPIVSGAAIAAGIIGATTLGTIGVQIARDQMQKQEIISKGNLFETHKIGDKITVSNFPQVRKKFAITMFATESENPKYFANFAPTTIESLIKLGFKEENIFILSATEIPNLAFSSMQLNKKSLFTAINTISSKSTEHDELFVSFEGHGTVTAKGVGILGKDNENEFINVTELDKKLSQIKMKFGVAIINSCNSGAGAKTIGKENFIAISPTTAELLAYGAKESSLVTNFLQSMTELKGDKDSDGKISILEAFEFAVDSLPATINDELSKQNMAHGLQVPQMYFEVADPSKITL